MKIKVKVQNVQQMLITCILSLSECQLTSAAAPEVAIPGKRVRSFIVPELRSV